MTGKRVGNFFLSGRGDDVNLAPAGNPVCGGKVIKNLVQTTLFCQYEHPC
jgi:hypothetical protein